MKMIDRNSAKNLERQILRWIWVRRYRMILFILSVLFLIIFSKAPYVNLFFNSYLIMFVSAILAPLILDIDDKPFFVTIFLFFSILPFVWLTDRDSSQVLTNYIFILLFSAVIKALHSSF